MKMKPFGERETTWTELTLSEIIGHLETLINNEDERTEKRRRGTPLDARMDVVHKAYELLQVADNGDVSIMRNSLKEFKI